MGVAYACGVSRTRRLENKRVRNHKQFYEACEKIKPQFLFEEISFNQELK